jgi:F-type H+-transporting ATPase subunit b
MQLLTPGLGLIIWTLISFLVVFFILKKYAWPAILGGLHKREQTIADSLAQEVESNKIITDAQEAINAQKMAALTEVKNQVGKLVIEVTEKILRNELSNKEVQEAHIKNLVNEVNLS